MKHLLLRFHAQWLARFTKSPIATANQSLRVVKRLLLAGLAAEGELPPRPKPAGNDAIGVFTRTDTGSADV